MKQILPPANATFSAAGATITFATTIPSTISHILHITNITRGVIYFQPQGGAAYGGTYASPVLTLTASTTGHADTDKLLIFYDDGLTGYSVTGPITNAELRSSNVNVAGTFWQATQPISGSVNIGNFPAIQPVSGTVTANQGGTWYVQSINSTSTVNSPNASNFLATVSGAVAATQSGDWTVKSPNASNFLSTVSGTVAATQSGTWNVGLINNPLTVAQSNASNFLATVSGTVAATQSGDWIVKQSNAANFLATISGTVTAVQSNASNFLTTVSGTVSANTNLSQIAGTTAAVNTGTASAGTLRVVLATDQPQLTNKLLVTPDANTAFNLSQVLGTTAAVNSGTLTAGTLRVVLATDQPQLTNKLLVTPDANSSFNLSQVGGSAVSATSGLLDQNIKNVGGSAVVASVTGVQDTMPRKRTGSTGLSPTYISGRINTSTTTQLVQSTVYLSTLQMSVYSPGTTWALNVTDRQALALPIVPNFVVTNVVGANNPITLAFAEPIVCTSGINVITVGGTAGNIAYFATYWS